MNRERRETHERVLFPETTGEKSEAYKAGYKTIAEISEKGMPARKIGCLWKFQKQR